MVRRVLRSRQLFPSRGWAPCLRKQCHPMSAEYHPDREKKGRSSFRRAREYRQTRGPTDREGVQAGLQKKPKQSWIRAGDHCFYPDIAGWLVRSLKWRLPPFVDSFFGFPVRDNLKLWPFGTIPWLFVDLAARRSPFHKQWRDRSGPQDPRPGPAFPVPASTRQRQKQPR